MSLPVAGPDFVVESGTVTLSRAELLERAESLALKLHQLGASRVALYADNGIDWIVADLACQIAELLVVPLPLFFSAEQTRHAIVASGIDTIIADRIFKLAPFRTPALPAGTQKITFTSGTTGNPKGVCLSADQQWRVAESLASAINLEKPRHLCVLPLSTLLENLAGVYAPLLAGGHVIVPPLADVGLTGSSGLDVKKLLAGVEQHQPDSLILVPEMLNAITLAASVGWQVPESLKFVAVGGGKTAPELLRRARAFGIPAFEGYGLSECASVVSLNVASNERIGSVGHPLPHVALEIEDNEIVIRGNTFLGYIDQPESWGTDVVRTGDLGHTDGNGFLHVDGRVKNVLISSFGRNISPEWIESELLAGPVLRQAIVIGDDRPHCVALVFPHDESASDQSIDSWIASRNELLPDYARIATWFRLPKALDVTNGLLTENGRPKRTEIETSYEFAIREMYEPRKKVLNA